MFILSNLFHIEITAGTASMNAWYVFVFLLCQAIILVAYHFFTLNAGLATNYFHIHKKFPNFSIYNVDSFRLTFEQRRLHISEYCQRNRDKLQRVWDDFENLTRQGRLQDKQTNFIRYNNPAGVLFCTPSKCGSTETLELLFHSTFTALTGSIEGQEATKCIKRHAKNPYDSNCVTRRLEGEETNAIDRIKTPKFMFFRHPLARLASSWHWKESVRCTFFNFKQIDMFLFVFPAT